MNSPSLQSHRGSGRRGTPPGGQGPADQPPRAALLARIADLAPAVRRAFEVRPDPSERALWQSLTVHQLEALAALDAGSHTMGELCSRLDISESAGTALCDRLVARHMVERRHDAEDRRVVRLALSGQARAMVERYRELKRHRLTELLSVLDTDDLATLVRIYDTVLPGAEDGRTA